MEDKTIFKERRLYLPYSSGEWEVQDYFLSFWTGSCQEGEAISVENAFANYVCVGVQTGTCAQLGTSKGNIKRVLERARKNKWGMVKGLM